MKVVPLQRRWGGSGALTREFSLKGCHLGRYPPQNNLPVVCSQFFSRSKLLRVSTDFSQGIIRQGADGRELPGLLWIVTLAFCFLHRGALVRSVFDGVFDYSLVRFFGWWLWLLLLITLAVKWGCGGRCCRLLQSGFGIFGWGVGLLGMEGGFFVACGML